MDEATTAVAKITVAPSGPPGEVVHPPGDAGGAMHWPSPLHTNGAAQSATSRQAVRHWFVPSSQRYGRHSVAVLPSGATMACAPSHFAEGSHFPALHAKSDRQSPSTAHVVLQAASSAHA